MQHPKKAQTHKKRKVIILALKYILILAVSIIIYVLLQALLAHLVFWGASFMQN